MAKITVEKYFPSAKAPWENGKHRLWSEENITNIFKAILDVDTATTPVISADDKYLIIDGYLFEGTWTAGNSYYIVKNTTTNEIHYNADPNAESILYDTAQTVTAPYICEGGTAQKIKILQSSLGDIDLNNN